MDSKEPANFDRQTVAFLRETLENAWASLRPRQQATMSRSLLAERILKCAAQGERDPQRLLHAARADLNHEPAEKREEVRLGRAQPAPGGGGLMQFKPVARTAVLIGGLLWLFAVAPTMQATAQVQQNQQNQKKAPQQNQGPARPVPVRPQPQMMRPGQVVRPQQQIRPRQLAPNQRVVRQPGGVTRVARPGVIRGAAGA